MRKAVIPIICLIVSLLIFKFVILIGYVPSESMEPTIRKNSFILCSRIYDAPKVGDIIVFRHNGRMLVKRIAEINDDEYYVLGDNAADSYDSRYWNEPYINYKDIAAKVILPRR